MKFYGENSKRIIKKHSSFMFDGVYYKWDTAMEIMKIISKLKPGHLVWIPWVSRWGILKSVIFYKRQLKNFRIPIGPDLESIDQLSRSISGWHLDEPMMMVYDEITGIDYCVYDIEHWNPWCKEKVKKEDFKMFNRQVDLPEEYLPKWWWK